MVAVSEIIRRLERYATRAYNRDDEVLRVRSIHMASPLEVILAGTAIMVPVVGIITAMVKVRTEWHQGTKTKHESKKTKHEAGSSLIDLRLKEQQLQRESDAQLEKELRQAMKGDEALESPLVNEILKTVPVEITENMTRRELLEACIAAVALPVNVEIESGTGHRKAIVPPRETGPAA
mgnify:CR=1 FL=1